VGQPFIYCGSKVSSGRVGSGAISRFVHIPGSGKVLKEVQYVVNESCLPTTDVELSKKHPAFGFPVVLHYYGMQSAGSLSIMIFITLKAVRHFAHSRGVDLLHSKVKLIGIILFLLLQGLLRNLK